MESNNNGKLSYQAYIDQILEPAIRPWLHQAKLGQIDPFALEEDRDSSHGAGSKDNIVAKWKDQNGLDHYFNCPYSPDLAPIEQCWQPMKQELRKIPHWDDWNTKSIAQDGWNKVDYEFINPKVASLPKRLKEVIDRKGALTGY